MGGPGDDTLAGGTGTNVLVGGGGIDTVDYSDASIGVYVNLLEGTANGSFRRDTLSGIENIQGSPFGDTLIGNEESNVIIGGGGSDLIEASSGNDYLHGNAGNDTLDGGSGTDLAFYQTGIGAVNVNLATGLAFGGDGNDSLISIENLVGSLFNDTLSGDDGANFLGGYGGNDDLSGAAGNDTLHGDDGDDTLTGGSGDDFLDGGAGNDTAIFSGPQSGYLITQTGVGNYLVGDLRGGNGVDTLTSIENLVFGGIVGTLDGGTIVGTAAADDLVTYKDALAAVSINLATGKVTSAAGSNTLVSIEGAIGSAFADTLIGNSEDNYLDGGQSADRMEGGRGADTYVVDNVNDVVLETDNELAIVVSGVVQNLDLGSAIDKVISSINYTLTAFVENLTLAGGAGNLIGIGNTLDNSLTGNEANNSFTGGTGNDGIDGKEGVDTAIFSGTRASTALGKNAAGQTVSASSAADGQDTLLSIERLKFADFGVALDIDGNAGTTAKILGAVFGAASVKIKEYVGIGLGLLDGDMSYPDLVQLAIDARLGANAGNAAVVTLLYTNVVGIEPSSAELAAFTSLLDSGAHTQASLGIFAADTSLNTANINLVGLSASGLEYL